MNNAQKFRKPNLRRTTLADDHNAKSNAKSVNTYYLCYVYSKITSKAL